MIGLLAFIAVAAPFQVAAAEAKPEKEAIVCVLRKGEMTAGGDFVPSEKDRRPRLLGIYFDAPKDKFAPLDSIQIHDPDQLLQGQPIKELMVVKQLPEAFAVFAGKKEGTMYTLISLRRIPQDGSFYSSLFRSGISGADTRAYQYAGKCKQGFGDDATSAFELVKSLSGQRS